MREVAVLRQIKHPNVIPLLKYFIKEESIFLVFDYFDFDLGELLYSLPKDVFLSPLQIKVCFLRYEGTERWNQVWCISLNHLLIEVIYPLTKTHSSIRLGD